MFYFQAKKKKKIVIESSPRRAQWITEVAHRFSKKKKKTRESEIKPTSWSHR